MLVAQSCVTLCNQVVCSPHDPLSREFSRQEYWSGLPLLLQGIFPTHRSNPQLLHGQVDSFLLSPQGLLKFMPNESVMSSNHLVLCRPLLLLPSFFPIISVFSGESALCIRWPKYWSFSFNISPSNEYSGLISFRMDWQSKGLSRSSPTP